MPVRLMRSAELCSVVLALLISLFMLWNATAQAEANKSSDVVSLGGAVTEIVFALGEGHRVKARDSTSSYPPEVMELPDVGYVRALSPEGVLSMGPELIVAQEGAGPAEAIDVLSAASIPYVEVPDQFDAQGVVDKIKIVGDALGVPDKAEALARQVADELALAESKAFSHGQTPKRVLFILSTQGGRIMASGENTAADGIIRMAGGINAMTGFEGYKPVSAEAVGAAAPDVVLMMDRAGNHASSNEDLFEIPALVTTPAARNNAVVRLNGLLLLGFGPRTGEAVAALNTALYN